MFNEISGGVTAAKQFSAAGIHCGVKRSRKDLAIIYSHRPAIAAGTFTTSLAAAPPVHVSRRILQKSPEIRAVVINSGNANACTGEKGTEDAMTMIRVAAQHLGIPENQCLVASTGVIGKYLPMNHITNGIVSAVGELSKDNHTAAAEAIMTTDTFIKECAVQFRINNTNVTIGGVAKGSGMIAPNMATMLGFVTTDIKISAQLLDIALKRAVDQSFNCISVDGETSTNDMVILLTNGVAGNPIIDDENSTEFELFYNALEFVLIKLARMIVVDGEGATKLIEIKIEGADDEASARAAGKAIAHSTLVKTAIHGEDPNWGRIMVALGYSGIQFDPADVEIYFGNVPVFRRNYTIEYDGNTLKKVLADKEISLNICLNRGSGCARFWTCDLSGEYVAINAHYRT